TETAHALDRRIGGRIAKLVKRGDIRGKAGETLLITDVDGAASERVLIVGLGPRASFKRKQYRKALASALGAIGRTGARNAVSYLGLEEIPDGDSYSLARAAAAAMPWASSDGGGSARAAGARPRAPRPRSRARRRSGPPLTRRRAGARGRR